MNRSFCTLALIVVCLGFSACKSTVDEYSSYRPMDAAKIYKRGNYHLQQGDYEFAAKDYEALEILYPFNDYAEQSHLNVIYAYYKSNDRASTMAAADRFIRLYPGSRQLDYAYYMRAMANYHHERPVLHKFLGLDRSARDLSLARKSFDDFNLISTRYPHSVYAKDAQYHMIKLHDILSRSEYMIADYYYRRSAYVAAANRASKLVNEFPQSPLTAKALLIMVESYRNLKLRTKADEALHVLEVNYPHSLELQAAKAYHV